MLFRISVMMWLCYCSSALAMAVPDVKTISMDSPYWPGTIDFSITLPTDYATQPDKRYSVLLDFNPRSHSYLTGLQNWLSQNSSAPWPATIIVTPTESNISLSHLLNKISTEHGHWLLDFIKQRLLATVDDRYRTNGFRIFSGFEGNANVVLYCFLNRPSLFNAYIAVSPDLQADQGNIIADAPTLLTKFTKLPRFVQISSGNSHLEQASQQTLLQLQQAFLAHAPPNLEWHIDRTSQHRLMSQPIVAVVTAMERIFADATTDLPADSAISRAGPEAIIGHYAYLSKQKYGFPVSAEGSLVNLAKDALASQPEQAIQILQTTLAHYPGSIDALHELAAAYAAEGQNSQAVQYQNQAIQQATRTATDQVAIQRQYLQRYQASLSERRQSATN